MNSNQNLTESQLKRKVIRISSKKKDGSLENKENCVPICIAAKKKLSLDQQNSLQNQHSILQGCQRLNSQNSSFMESSQPYQDQFLFSIVHNQTDRPFYMQTSRRQEQGQFAIQMQTGENKSNLPLYLARLMEKQKQVARRIWIASKIVRKLGLRMYYKQLKNGRVTNKN